MCNLASRSCFEPNNSLPHDIHAFLTGVSVLRRALGTEHKPSAECQLLKLEGGREREREFLNFVHFFKKLSSPMKRQSLCFSSGPEKLRERKRNLLIGLIPFHPHHSDRHGRHHVVLCFHGCHRHERHELVGFMK